MLLKNYFLIIFILFGLGLNAQSFQVPALNSPVMDEVGLLSESAKKQIENSLYDFRKSNGAQIQVYIVRSLQGLGIEEAAIKIFDQWKLGDEKTDRGLLFLIAPNEKRMRIEVGQGLEGDVPDVIAKRIISDVVKPYFQRGEFDLGVGQAVNNLQNYISITDPKLKADLQKDHSNKSEKQNFWIILIVIGIWIILFLINPSLALNILFFAMRGGGGGGSGRDSWSGGGGSSSGGGASGDW